MAGHTPWHKIRVMTPERRAQIAAEIQLMNLELANMSMVRVICPACHRQNEIYVTLFEFRPGEAQRLACAYDGCGETWQAQLTGRLVGEPFVVE